MRIPGLTALKTEQGTISTDPLACDYAYEAYQIALQDLQVAIGIEETREMLNRAAAIVKKYGASGLEDLVPITGAQEGFVSEVWEKIKAFFAKLYDMLFASSKKNDAVMSRVENAKSKLAEQEHTDKSKDKFDHKLNRGISLKHMTAYRDVIEDVYHAILGIVNSAPDIKHPTAQSEMDAYLKQVSEKYQPSINHLRETLVKHGWSVTEQPNLYGFGFNGPSPRLQETAGTLTELGVGSYADVGTLTRTVYAVRKVEFNLGDLLRRMKIEHKFYSTGPRWLVTILGGLMTDISVDISKCVHFLDEVTHAVLMPSDD